MSLSKDIESPQNSKKLGPAMSYRQQIRYVLEKSLEENIGSHMLVPEIQLHELEEYLQDEDMRVSHI